MEHLETIPLDSEPWPSAIQKKWREEEGWMQAMEDIHCEFDLYGIYDCILNYLFRPFESDFSVAPSNRLGALDIMPSQSSITIIVYTTVKAAHDIGPHHTRKASHATQIPVLFIEIRSGRVMQDQLALHSAMEQVSNRFLQQSGLQKTPRLYGISAIGPYIAAICQSKDTNGTIRLNPPAEYPKPGPAPQLWKTDIRTQEGKDLLGKIASDIKQMCTQLGE